MSSGNPTFAARRTKTYANTKVAVTNGVATKANLTTVQTLTVGDFTGTEIAVGVFDLPRAVSLTAAAFTAAYSTSSAVVVTGMRGNHIVTQSMTPVANGGTTVLGTQAFDKLTSISIPAQALTDGTLSIGVGDICAPAGDAFCGVEPATTGSVFVQYGEGADAPIDTLPMVASTFRAIAPTRINTGTGKTTVGVTVYLP